METWWYTWWYKMIVWWYKWWQIHDGQWWCKWWTIMTNHGQNDDQAWLIWEGHSSGRIFSSSGRDCPVSGKMPAATVPRPRSPALTPSIPLRLEPVSRTSSPAPERRQLGFGWWCCYMLVLLNIFWHLFSAYFEVIIPNGFIVIYIYSIIVVLYIRSFWDGLKLETSWNHQSLKNKVFCPSMVHPLRIISIPSTPCGGVRSITPVPCYVTPKVAAPRRTGRWANEERLWDYG